MFGEPQPTPYDVRFQVFGFPIRITPWFWLVAIILSGGHGNGLGILIFVLAVLLSLVIHELGHAWAFRYFGISSHIVLYQFGGLAIPDSFGSSWGRQSLAPGQSAMVSAAGPLAQIMAAILVILSVAFSGHGMRSLGMFDAIIPVPDGASFTSPELNELIDSFCWVSLYWAVFNLIPVLPLDGGHITRDLLIVGGARNPLPTSLMISLCAAGAMFLYGVQQGSVFICLLFFSLGYSSYMALHQPGGGGFNPRTW